MSWPDLTAALLCAAELEELVDEELVEESEVDADMVAVAGVSGLPFVICAGPVPSTTTPPKISDGELPLSLFIAASLNFSRVLSEPCLVL